MVENTFTKSQAFNFFVNYFEETDEHYGRMHILDHL